MCEVKAHRITIGIQLASIRKCPERLLSQSSMTWWKGSFQPRQFLSNKVWKEDYTAKPKGGKTIAFERAMSCARRNQKTEGNSTVPPWKRLFSIKIQDMQFDPLWLWDPLHNKINTCIQYGEKITNKLKTDFDISSIKMWHPHKAYTKQITSNYNSLSNEEPFILTTLVIGLTNALAFVLT